MAKKRKSIRSEVMFKVLHLAGYHCSNPACRSIITLELHHLVNFSQNGPDTADNLIALCPNCHTRHHNGEIPFESLKAWRQNQLALNNAFDRQAVSILLMLSKLKSIRVSGDALITAGELIASGYADAKDSMLATVQNDGNFSTTPIYELTLTQKGTLFTENWIDGKPPS